MKSRMKCFLVSVLLAAVLLNFVSTAYALEYSTDISSIMLEFSLQNSYADSTVQQAVNGTYRTVELLELIASEWD